MSNGLKRALPAAAFTHREAEVDWATSPDRVPVFTVSRENEETGEAEVVTYTMPAKPNPGVALEYLRMIRKIGDAASSWLIETAVGEEGYDALIEEFSNLPEGENPVAILRAISEKIQTIVMGGLDNVGPKG
jgi:hypothetical protein